MAETRESIGVDIAKDWIDVQVLSNGAQRRIPTKPKALERFAKEAAAIGALEASGKRRTDRDRRHQRRLR